jgi:hypothetical protein
MKEFIVQGTAHGRPTKVRVFAQNAHAALEAARQQTGDRHMSFYKTTAV